MEPDLYAVITTLAIGRNVTRSFVVQQLLADALNLQSIQKEYMETVEKIGRVDDLPDNRKKPKQRHHHKDWEEFKQPVDDVIDVEVTNVNQIPV